MLRSEVVLSDPFAARLNRSIFSFVLSEVEFLSLNGSVVVKGSIREGTRSRGMRMATRLSETSIIQLLPMHLVLLIVFLVWCCGHSC